MEFDDQSLDVTGVDDQRGRSGGFPGGGKGIAAGGGGILD